MTPDFFLVNLGHGIVARTAKCETAQALRAAKVRFLKTRTAYKKAILIIDSEMDYFDAISTNKDRPYDFDWLRECGKAGVSLPVYSEGPIAGATK